MDSLQVMASVYLRFTRAEAASSVSNPNPVVAVENDQSGILPAGHGGFHEKSEQSEHW